MSPLVITLLIVTGIVILIAIGYTNHLLENSRLKKARQRADLSDRMRRCATLSNGLPGQFMTPPLKLLLSQLELQQGERLLPLDKRNAALKARIDELRTMIAQGQSIAVTNAPLQIIEEAQAKEVRFQLENLHSQITRAAQESQLDAAEAKRWLGEIRLMLVQLHIEFFTNLGQRAMQQQQPGQARLAFERGVQYLRKQPDPARYASQLQQLEKLLERANAMVLASTAPAADEPSELTEGLKSLEDDDDWKKKNIYD